jgi:hypothetical protein
MRTVFIVGGGGGTANADCLGLSWGRGREASSPCALADFPALYGEGLGGKQPLQTVLHCHAMLQWSWGGKQPINTVLNCRAR